MVWNFLITNQRYREIGRMLSGPELTNEQQKLNIEADKRRHRGLLLREGIALYLLIVETVLIVVLLYLADR